MMLISAHSGKSGGVMFARLELAPVDLQLHHRIRAVDVLFFHQFSLLVTRLGRANCRYNLV